MERLLANAPGILLVFDAALNVVNCFGNAVSLLGWSPEELRGQHANRLFDISNLDYVDAYVEVLRAGKRYEGPGALQTRAGESVELSLFAQFVPGMCGSPDRFVLHCQDRRAQQELEEQLLRMKQYEHIGWMAQGLVHDLNHALTLALLHLDDFSELLDDADHNPSLESARLSLREASNLSRGVMQISRSDRAEQVRVLELDQWLSQVSRPFQLIIPPGIELSLIASSGLIVSVIVSRLQQLLFNLIHNAAMAICQQKPEPPRIRLVCEASETPGMATIRVEDNGCGMDEEAQGQAFMPFYTTRADGSGLGLYMCKLIVERWGGQIAIVSQLGQGTRVSFTLPLAL
jgi:signal transduction histidine kinase